MKVEPCDSCGQGWWHRFRLMESVRGAGSWEQFWTLSYQEEFASQLTTPEVKQQAFFLRRTEDVCSIAV